MYEMGHNQEQFDLIRAFDYNPPHNFTKIREKMTLLIKNINIHEFQ